jgi:hypothetical protein
MTKTTAKMLVVLASLAATCYLTANSHRVTAFGSFCLAVLAIFMLPDDEENSTPKTR